MKSGSGSGEAASPIIEALNKIDLLDDENRARILAQTPDDAVAISALTGEGVDKLQALISAMLQRSARVYDYVLGPQDGKRAAWLYEHGEVVERRDADDGSLFLRVRLGDEEHARFEGRR